MNKLIIDRDFEDWEGDMDFAEYFSKRKLNNRNIWVKYKNDKSAESSRSVHEFLIKIAMDDYE